MRVILDTNILVSRLFAPAAVPGQLVEAWLDHRFTLVSHPLQLDEFREVSRLDKVRTRVRPSEVGRLVNLIAALAVMPDRLPPVERSRDPRDDFLLALCEEGSADRLVTGDKADLLSLGQHGSTRIVTATAFAFELGLKPTR